MVLEEFGAAAESAFPLSGAGLRNYLSTNVPLAFYQEGSGAEQLAFLRLNGVIINTQDFYDIRATVLIQAGATQGLRRSLSQLENLVPDSYIPLAYTQASPWSNQSSRYMYRYQLNGTNPDTGETTTEYMMVGSDDQLTFQQAHDLASELAIYNIDSQGNIVTSDGNILGGLTLDAAYQKY